jgi:4-alpha-glucanotransferase
MEIPHLRQRAERLGVAIAYTDGRGRRLEVGAETLRRVVDALERGGGATGGTAATPAPVTPTWHRTGTPRSWGVATHLAALRTARSRAVADLRDFESAARWIREHGGDVITVLPLLPTYNTGDAEPSPYAAVSRLFWSELMLDLGESHRPVGVVDTLDVTRADAEVRTALRHHPRPPDASIDDELRRYARFRGAQARLGRNWRDWPDAARNGAFTPDQVDADEERFHLVAQLLLREQLAALRARLDAIGMRIGLDLPVGVHPDGYDAWSRRHLLVEGMSVGAPPDEGFPSGQDWGFPPMHPLASAREGHAYLRAAIAHQASLAGVLRIDHVMSLARLYWIPHGMSLHEGTYVDYPAEELFAILAEESHRHRCEIVGENLGTVPPSVDAALARFGIRGMYVAQFAAHESRTPPPTATDVAMIGTHDTPTLMGWLTGGDIAERVALGLLAADDVQETVAERHRAISTLAETLGVLPDDPGEFLGALLERLGRSDAPLVIAWLEDLWLEAEGVNLPGTTSSARPNWQRPMRRRLEEVVEDPTVRALMTRLDHARG